MNDPVQLVTNSGRLVAGEPFKPNDKDAEGKQLVYRSGDNKGQPRKEWYVALAIPKSDEIGWNTIWGKIVEVARTGFPHLFAADGSCLAPKFAYKVMDGDSTVPNTKGVKPCDREGYPGHWVLNFSNGYAPKVLMQLPGQAMRELAAPEAGVHRGCFARVAFEVRGNESTQNPGVFLNQTMIQIVGYGPEIRFGADPSQVFGDAAVTLPAGASVTPVVSGPAPAPGATAAQTGAPPVPGATVAAPAAPGPSAPATVAPPVPGFSNGPGAAPGAAPAPPAAEPTRITPDGRTWKEADLRAAGWNDEQLSKLPSGDDDIPY